MIVTDLIDCLRGDQGNLFAPLVEAEQHMVSFVCAAAPNLKTYRARFIPEVLRQQMRNVIYAPLLSKLQRLQSAQAPWHHHGMDDTILILGAWGCGAFGNDPWVIAPMFAEILAGIMMDIAVTKNGVAHL